MADYDFSGVLVGSGGSGGSGASNASIATSQYMDSQISNVTPVITIDRELKIIIGDEEITGDQLAQMIKVMKIQYPEVFI